MKFELSLKKGSPRAIVEGGKYNKEIIHIFDKDNIDCKHQGCNHGNCQKCLKGGCDCCLSGGNLNNEAMDELIRQMMKNLKGRITFRDLDILYKSIVTQSEPDDLRLKKLYDQLLSNIQGSQGKEIIVNSEAKLRPIPDTSKERNIVYITGMSGSGKSTYAGHYAEMYNKIFPKNPIYLLSNKTKDSTLDKYDFFNRIPLNENLVEDPLNLDELHDSLVIMDDIEGTPDKKLENELDRIRDLILQQGRDRNISMCYISHLANNYKKTRLILNECDCCVIYPQNSTRYSLKYLLEKYFGFSKKDLEKLYNIPSRWITIHKSPLFVLHEKGGYLLN